MHSHTTACDCLAKREEIGDDIYFNRRFRTDLNKLYVDRPTDILGASSCCGALKLKIKGRKGKAVLEDRSHVVFVDGACSGNGQEGARAAFGIYFGDTVPHNDFSLIDEHLPQNNQYAQLFAATVALKIMRSQMDEDIRKNIDREYRHICKVVIATDSAYVVDGISDWIFKWKENGFKTSTGKRVANSGLFQELDSVVQDFREEGIPVWFWHVKRQFNRSAEALARVPLYGDQEIPALVPFVRK